MALTDARRTTYRSSGVNRKRSASAYPTRPNKLQRSAPARLIKLNKVGFPKQMKMTHRYVENISLTCTSGILQRYQFRANGMFDPNLTSTGHQPMYFDQMAALYNHYVVEGSRITIKAITPGSTAVNVIACALNCDDDTTATYSNMYSVIEDDCDSWGYTGGLDNKTLTLKEKFKTKDVFGGNPQSNPDLIGKIGADPTEVYLYNFFIQTLDETSSVTVRFVVEIEFEATWFERKNVASS